MAHEVVRMALVQHAAHRLRQDVRAVEAGRDEVKLHTSLLDGLLDECHSHAQMTSLPIWCRAIAFQESNGYLRVSEDDGWLVLWKAQLRAKVSHPNADNSCPADGQ